MTQKKPKMFFFFLDGIGITDNPENPVKDFLKPFKGQIISPKVTGTTSSPPENSDWQLIVRGLDAVMDVKGMPQSATGQTSIFTGTNAQGQIGYHLNAYPNEPLINIINQRNLLKSLVEKGLKVTSANQYSRQYFELRKNKRKNQFSVSTLVIDSSNCGFRMIEDKQPAVFADITGDLLRERGIDYPYVSPEDAGKIMAGIITENDFTVFEYFMTDLYGHKKNGKALIDEVSKLNSFIASITKECQSPFDILFCSDHGNAEDMTTADHTVNPALFGFYSRNLQTYFQKVLAMKDLSDIYDFVVDYFCSD